MKRIGIFGGSFDPVHIGHLILAESCRESLKLDTVLLIPAEVSPFKTEQRPSSSKHRLEMLELATSGNPFFSVDDRELKRGGISYTVDTLTNIKQEQSDCELFLLMGADSLVDFGRWKAPETICELASPAIVHRPGNAMIPWDVLRPYLDPKRLQAVMNSSIEMPLIDISSRDIRHRVSISRSIRYRVPPAVEAYIHQHRLYLPEEQ